MASATTVGSPSAVKYSSAFSGCLTGRVAGDSLETQKRLTAPLHRDQPTSRLAESSPARTFCWAVGMTFRSHVERPKIVQSERSHIPSWLLYEHSTTSHTGLF